MVFNLRVRVGWRIYMCCAIKRAVIFDELSLHGRPIRTSAFSPNLWLRDRVSCVAIVISSTLKQAIRGHHLFLLVQKLWDSVTTEGKCEQDITAPKY